MGIDLALGLSLLAIQLAWVSLIPRCSALLWGNVNLLVFHTSLLLPSLLSHSFFFPNFEWDLLSFAFSFVLLGQILCASSPLPSAISCRILEYFFNSVLATKLFLGLAMGFLASLLPKAQHGGPSGSFALNLFFQDSTVCMGNMVKMITLSWEEHHCLHSNI